MKLHLSATLQHFVSYIDARVLNRKYSNEFDLTLKYVRIYGYILYIAFLNTHVEKLFKFLQKYIL